MTSFKKRIAKLEIAQTKAEHRLMSNAEKTVRATALPHESGH